MNYALWTGIVALLVAAAALVLYIVKRQRDGYPGTFTPLAPSTPYGFRNIRAPQLPVPAEGCMVPCLEAGVSEWECYNRCCGAGCQDQW